MIKAIGLLGSQIGDLVICTPAIKQFKLDNPNFHFTLGISKKYAHVKPLFLNLDFIDDILVWDTNVDDWPNSYDAALLRQKRFNIIFGSSALHTYDYWYLLEDNHYTREFGRMFGIDVKDCQCELNPWFGNQGQEYKKVITLSMFPSMDIGQKKSLSIEQLEDLCINIKTLGYKPWQLGGKFEPKLQNAEKDDSMSLLEASAMLYSSRLHLTCDTSLGWVSSAYKCPTIGFFTNNLPYMTKETSVNIQPVNPNQYIFHRDDLNILKTEEIIDKIKQML